MRIRYTRHAVLKMLERGISLDEVEALILRSLEKYLNTKQGMYVVVKRGDGRPLVVVYRVEDEQTVIVTVFSPSNINKLVERRKGSGRWRVWRR